MRSTGPTAERGFTLAEMAVTMLIIAVLAALAAIGVQRMRPRASLATTTAELAALLNAARQNALSTGYDTVVMFFTQEPNPRGGTGRVILYEDHTFNFFDGAAATNFGGYTAATPISPNSSSDAFETLDLPRGMSFGFGGVAPATLAAPYTLVPVAACSFCASGNGAVVFDSKGRARFYNANGVALSVTGGTIALRASDVTGYRIIVITPTTGSVKAFNLG
jgi:prepilin-type N-terminal cleavage/methylation domain-containing protein